MRHMRNFRLFILVFSSILFFFQSSCKHSETLEVRDFFAMDTLCRIQVDEEHMFLLADAERMTKAFEDRLSRFKEGSVLVRLNKDRSVNDDELVKILMQYSQLPDDVKAVFSVLLGDIIDSWDIRDGGKVPLNAELAALLHDFRTSKFSIQNTVVTLHGNADMDLGGLLKGYLCGELARYFESQGVKRYIIDLGGNIAVYSSQPYTWKIGIKNPDGDGIAGYIQSDKQRLFVATSGNYERFFIKDGKRYHHILDPNTGYPSEGMKSVTVVTDSGIMSDVLSTVFFIMKEKKATRFLTAQPQTAVIFIDSVGTFQQINCAGGTDDTGMLFWQF